MKKIVSLIMVMALILSMLPLMPVSVDAVSSKNEGKNIKRLATIIQTMPGDEDTKEYTFTYNEWNLPASIHYESSSGYEYTVEYIYDKEGRFIRTGSSKETVYTYDSNGRLTKYVDRVGDMVSIFTYFYDSDGKLDHSVCDNGHYTETTKYFYDQSGNLESAQSESYSEYYTYDSQGRVQQEQNDYATITYSYNADGQLESAYTVRNHPTMLITSRVKYDYESNAPFIVAHGEGTSSELWIEDTEGHTVWSLEATRSSAYTGDLTFETDSNGLVISAEDELWKWEFVYEDIEVEQDFFVIGRDSNRFSHTPDDFGYNKDTGVYFAPIESRVGTGYPITAVYYNRLIAGMSEGERARFLDEKMNAEWSGACYGIALSMLWANVGKADISKFYKPESGFYDSEVTCYNELPLPMCDVDIRDYIYYCHLLQHTDQVTSEQIININSIGDGSWKLFAKQTEWFAFWEALREETITACNQAEPILLNVRWKDGIEHGHTLIICGYIDDSEEYMIFKLYDGNTQDQYIYLCVSRSSAYAVAFIQEDGKVSDFNTGLSPVSADNWVQFDYQTVNSLGGADPSIEIDDGNTEIISKSAVQGDSGKVVFTVDLNSEFKLVADNGRYLAFDGSAYTGDITVYDARIVGESDMQIEITLDAGTQFRLVDFTDGDKYAICSDNTYMTASVSGADEIIFSTDAGIEFKGTDYRFDASLSLPADVGNVYFSGLCDENCTIAYDSGHIEAETPGVFSSMEIKTFKETEAKSTIVDGTISDIRINKTGRVQNSAGLIYADQEDATETKVIKSNTQRWLYIVGGIAVVACIVVCMAVLVLRNRAKKKILFVALISIVIVSAALLITLCHEHTWLDATCTSPKTCSKCGESEGTALEHQKCVATCNLPETCALCGETFGTALGHTWVDATCTAPQTCSICGETYGDVVHQWADATYESPKTCGRCGLTEGSRLIPDPVYINELDVYDKYGKLWTMSEHKPNYYVHEDVTNGEDYKDMNTPGHTTGPVYDYLGNSYTYGLHIDGDEYSAFFVSYDIGGIYSTFTGAYCMSPDMDGDSRASKEKYFEVYGDGVLLFRSVEISQGSAAKTFNIDVSGVEILTIRYPKTSGPSRIATIFDGKLS